MKTLFPLFGTKGALAVRYSPPIYNTIIEPFAGAAGYSMLHHERKVILVERDERLHALWNYLIKVTPQEIMKLPLLEFSQSVRDLKICREAQDLVGFWLNKGGRAPKNKATSWAYLDPKTHWGKQVRAEVAIGVSKIKHWQLIHGDYTAAPDMKATYFIDPPYQKAGVEYRYSSKRIDFDYLGLWCARRRGQIMVCENLDADWLPFKPFKVIHGIKKLSAEVLWESYRE